MLGQRRTEWQGRLEGLGMRRSQAFYGKNNDRRPKWQFPPGTRLISRLVFPCHAASVSVMLGCGTR